VTAGGPGVDALVVAIYQAGISDIVLVERRGPAVG
jgi:hypothetical protein